MTPRARVNTDDRAKTSGIALKVPLSSLDYNGHFYGSPLSEAAETYA